MGLHEYQDPRRRNLFYFRPDRKKEKQWVIAAQKASPYAADRDSTVPATSA
jgi:hypothetical protein